MGPVVAYLANGKLFLKQEGQSALPIESQFAQEMIEQAIRSRERNEWKTRSQTGRLMSGRPLLGDTDDEDPTARRIHISGITRGDPEGTLLYALDTDRVGGLFLYDPSEGSERRLFHNPNFRARHLSRHPAWGMVAFSLHADDGTSSIAVMEMNGSGLQTVTEGDSLDESPAWIPGTESKLVFQSAGIGRDPAGHIAGIGPYAVQLLDLDQGDLTTLLEDPAKDFLLPRMAGNGSLYFIRRPYQPVRHTPILAILKDALLLPVRLVWAVFGFLNFFSLMFGGKPLMTAGGVKREGPSPRHMLLWGKVIDAERAERQAKAGSPAALVPRDWELVCRSPAGAETVLAQSVISFDLCDDGGVVYTNGTGVYYRTSDGQTESVCDGRMIEHVVIAA